MEGGKGFELGTLKGKGNRKECMGEVQCEKVVVGMEGTGVRVWAGLLSGGDIPEENLGRALHDEISC